MNLNAQIKDKGIALKTEENSPDNAPYSEKEITFLTYNFGKLLRSSGKTSRNKKFIRSESRDVMNDNMQRTERHVERKVFDLK